MEDCIVSADQTTMFNLLDTETDLEKQKKEYDAKVEKLIFDYNDNTTVTDIVYILGTDKIFNEVVLNKYATLEQLRGKEAYESIFSSWCFVFETIDKEFHKEGLTETAFKQIRQRLLIDIRRTKLSWIEMAEKSLLGDNRYKNKFLDRQLTECKQSYLRDPASIREKYGVKKPDDLVKHYKEWFGAWTNRDRLMVEYPFLLDLTPKKIENAFRLDLINCTTRIIAKEYGSNIKMIKNRRPEELIKIALFTPTTRRAGEFSPKKQGKNISFEEEFDYSELWASSTSPNDGSVEVLRSLITFDPNQLKVSEEQRSDNEFINTIINNTLAPDVFSKIKDNPSSFKSLYTNITLDKTDKALLGFTFSKSQSQRVRVYSSEIIKALGLSDGEKNYKNIESRILKYPGYWYTAILSNGDKVSFNFINSVISSEDESGKFFDITLGDNLFNSIERGRVYDVYSKELNKLQNPLAEDLAFIFEMERRRLINAGVNINDRTFSYTIDFFKQYVYLDRKFTLKKNMDTLQEGIERLCTNKLVVKTCERHLDYFSIGYYPDAENSKSIINSSFAYLTENNKE